MSGAESGSGRWSALRRNHPQAFAIVVAIVAVLVAADLLLAARWLLYRRETAQLLGEMTDVERERAALLAASAEQRALVMSESLRRQAAADRALHLAVALDSGVMRLERDGAKLREMRVTIGPPPPSEGGPADATDATDAASAADAASATGGSPLLGTRTVERVLAPRDAWELPAHVFSARALPVPEERRIPGVLGRDALVLAGGTVIYALPDSGVLADSSYVLPGALRLSRRDLRAIAPVITAGTTVYFFE